MYSLPLALVLFHSAFLAKAGIYVTSPSSGGACHGGQPCTVNWVDDGRAPLLSDIGVANIGLYTGQQQLLQTIEPVDVSKTHSFTFTPDTKVGPNSGSYYIGFTSVSSRDSNGNPNMAFSPWFNLDNMSGSFSGQSPVATSTASTPSSLVSGSAASSAASSGVASSGAVGTSNLSSTVTATTGGASSTTRASQTTAPTSSGFSTAVSGSSSVSHASSSTTRGSAAASPTRSSAANKISAATSTWSLVGVVAYLGFSFF